MTSTEHYNTNGLSVNRIQILIGVVGLLIGAFVYITDRPPDQTYFVYTSSFNLSLYNVLPKLFGLIGNYLPTFIHVFSFSLITAGIITCQKRGYKIICLAWFIIDCAFEVGQKFNLSATKIIPDWFDRIPFLENTENYLSQGIFDPIDLFSIIVGSVLAYFVIEFTMEGRQQNEKPEWAS